MKSGRALRTILFTDIVGSTERASEVLVRGAVRDAETGSGFAFEDLGPRELKGVDRAWRLFRVTGLPKDAEGPGFRVRSMTRAAPVVAKPSLNHEGGDGWR